MKILISLFFLWINFQFFFVVLAQDVKIDSLRKVIVNSKNDTTLFGAYYWLGDLYQGNNADSSHYYLNKSIDIANQIKDDLRLGEAYRTKGWTFYTLSDYSNAQLYYEKSLTITEKLLKETNKSSITISRIKRLKASSIRNIGVLYDAKSLYPDAIKLYFESLKIYQELGDKLGESGVLGALGISYKDQGDYSRALEYYHKSLSINNTFNNLKGKTSNFINLGNLHYDLLDYDSTLFYYSQALSIYLEQNNKRGLGIVYGNIGSVFEKKGDLEKALNYYEQALEINEELGNLRIQVINMIDLGNIHLQNNNYKKAQMYFQKSNHIAISIEANDLIQDSYLNLSIVNEKSQNYKNSLMFYKKYVEFKDSLFSLEAKNSSIELEYQFEYEVKKTKDSLINQKKVEIFELENSKQKAEIDANRTRQLALYGGLFILLIFIGFIYNRFKITQRQKDIIEKQKTEVELQREFAEQQRNIAEEKRVEADEQRHLVEEKNKEITDSINYAKRIQEAILPSRFSLVENLKNGFIFFKPKDVVSGDFYWLETYAKASVSEGNNLTTPLAPSNGGGTGVVYFAAADCTGHGVPGAMVSVICSNALSKALLEEGITDPGKLLDRTRDLVIERFAKSGEQVKDGMDISLCKLTGNQLEWSGANNPIWIVRKIAADRGEETSSVRNETHELIELKPDKQPIGNYAEPKPFTTHTVALSKGDTLYIFTDGFADQFGGPKGKKFMYKPFKELVLSMQAKTMDEQRSMLSQTFDEWKGAHEQIDDVCIIGVRL